MKITPILWTYDERADGTFALKIRHSYVKDKKKVRDYYMMNVYLTEAQWDNENSRAKAKIIGAHSNAIDINLKLLEIENTTEKEYLKNPNVDIGKVINDIINPPSPVPVIKYDTNKFHVASYFTNYCDLCKEGKVLRRKVKTKMTEGYLKTFNTTKMHIEAFEKHTGARYEFNDITEEWHNMFITFLRYNYIYGKKKKEKNVGVAENTIAKSVKNLKTIMAHSRKKAKLHINFDYEDFDASWEEVDNIALNDDEIDAIIGIDSEEYPYLRVEQERFAVAYNFLLRHNDSINIDKRNIFFEDKQAFFRKTTEKTKTNVIIPVMPRVLKILKKYNYALPSISVHKSNKKLKMLGLLAKLNTDYTVTEHRKGKHTEVVYKRYELITSHTTRRSAATNLYLAGMDLESIRLMGAWKSIKQLMDYIKIDKLENAKRVSSHPFFRK